MVVRLEIENKKNEKVKLFYGGKIIKLEPLQTKLIEVLPFAKYMNCKYHVLFPAKNETIIQHEKIRLKILKYRFSQKVIFRLFCLAVCTILAFIKFNENVYILGLILFISTMSFVDSVFFYDVIEQVNEDTNPA